MRVKLTLALAFLCVALVAAAAFAQTPSATPNPKSGEKKAEGFGKHRMVHGEFKVQTADGFSTVVKDVGVVTAVNAGAGRLSLKRADNEVVTVTVGDATKIRRNGEQAGLSDVKVGDLVHTMQVDSGDGYELRVIGARAPDWKPERKGHFRGRGFGRHGGFGAPPAAGGEMPMDGGAHMDGGMPMGA